MRRNQYSSAKRRKELDRKKKQEEKRQKKLERRLEHPEDGTVSPEGAPEGGGTQAPAVPEHPPAGEAPTASEPSQETPQP